MKRTVIITMLIIVAAAAFTLAPQAPAAAGGRASVVVNGESRITEDYIVLGKIASISGEDSLLVERMASIVIGRSPLPKQDRIIDGEHIKQKLKQKGILLAKIDFKSPKKVKVSRAYSEISGETIKQIVKGFILDKMSWNRDQVNIKGMDRVGTIVLPEGSVTYQVIPQSNEAYLGPTPLSVVFKVNGKQRKRMWVNPHIEVFGPTVVTTRPMPRFHVVNEADLKVEKRNLVTLASNVLINPGEAIGKRLKTSVTTNTPLRTDMLELPPLVKRGDLVIIVFESEHLRITTTGVVKDKGRRGDTVRVINIISRKEIYGRVIDGNTIKVNF